VGLAGPVEKTPATEAERRIDRFQLPEALPADDFLTNLLEEKPTDLASGREEDKLPQLSPPGKPPDRKEH
jgi:hypothetical protein